MGPGIRPGGKARVSSVVGLSLLEVIRALDLPTEVLAAEDPTQTMPRRLGLSEVVDQQIRLFKEQVRRREKITDQQAQPYPEKVIDNLPQNAAVILRDYDHDNRGELGEVGPSTSG